MRASSFAVAMSGIGAVGGMAYGIIHGAGLSTIGLYAFVGAVLSALLIFFIVRSLPGLAGDAMQAALMPTGNTTPYETDFSYEMALAMKGDVKTALQSFEEKIAAAPTNAAVRLKAAEMYLSDGNAERARELFREVQKISSVERLDDVLASYRLIDLYRGKLGEPAKALPEFRRLIERYPDSQIETQAREALAKLKSEINFEQ